MLMASPEPLSTRYDPDDDQWEAQVNEFYQLLVEEIPEARLASVAQTDAKGSVDSVIIALGGAHVITNMVHCFRFWLDRDKSRELLIRLTVDGEKRKTILIKGDPIDAAAMRILVEGAVRELTSRP